MIEGKTKSGFEYKVNENIYKDWEFVTIADKVQNGEGTMKDVNDILNMVIGKEGFDNLKEHIRAIFGYVDTEAVKAEFAEITSATKVKN